MDSSRKYHRTSRGRFRTGKYRARRKGIPWSLSLSEFESITENAVCHYCSGDLSATGSNLDRKNNLVGYHVDNVVPCCAECNGIKSDKLNYVEAKIALSAIRAYRETKKK